MATEQEINRLKRKVDKMKENKRVNELRKKQFIEELKEEFGVDNLKKAVELLKKKKKELEALGEKRNEKYDEFIDKYAEELEID